MRFSSPAVSLSNSLNEAINYSLFRLILLQTSSLMDIMQEFEEIEEQKILRRQQNVVDSVGKTRSKQIKKKGG